MVKLISYPLPKTSLIYGFKYKYHVRFKKFEIFYLSFKAQL